MPPPSSKSKRGGGYHPHVDALHCAVVADNTLLRWREHGIRRLSADAFNERTSDFFLLQTHYDDDLQQDVGGLVRDNNQRRRIPLVASDEIQDDALNTGQPDFRKNWLEVVDRQVTGQYILHGTVGGTVAGRHVEYTNFRTKRVTLFRITLLDSPCTNNR